MEKERHDELIVQNLLDADCDREMIDSFFALQAEKKTQAQLTLLCRHRKILLDKMHERQKHLDCLDYLIYQIKKKHG